MLVGLLAFWLLSWAHLQEGRRIGAGVLRGFKASRSQENAIRDSGVTGDMGRVLRVPSIFRRFLLACRILLELGLRRVLTGQRGRVGAGGQARGPRSGWGNLEVLAETIESGLHGGRLAKLGLEEDCTWATHINDSLGGKIEVIESCLELPQA